MKRAASERGGCDIRIGMHHSSGVASQSLRVGERSIPVYRG